MPTDEHLSRVGGIAAILGVIVLVAATMALALVGPRADVGFVHGSDGLGWVPPGLRTLADGVRDDIVIGCDDPAAAVRISDLYRAVRAPVLVTDPASAEG